MSPTRAVTAAIALCCTLAVQSLLATTSWYDFAHDHVIGTSLDLHFEAASPEAAGRAEAAALAEIDRLAAILSGYDAKSEFSRWMVTRDRPVSVSADLYAVLALFDHWRAATNGTLEAATEAAAQLWRTAAERGSAPSEAELAATVAAMRTTHWRLDPAARTATHLSHTPLRLNSFAKGYIIDRAAAAALSAGPVTTAVVNIGGDLVVQGQTAQVVAVTDPSAAADNEALLTALRVSNRAVATSGGYRRGYKVGDRAYSHLINPLTALPATEVASATVVARDAVEAGALATTLGVLSVDEGVQFMAQRPGVEYLLVLADGQKLTSPGWGQMVRPLPAAPLAKRAAAAEWLPVATPVASPTPLTEATIALQIASPGGRAKRPFVAVWIEDKDGFPVRTLALWYHGNRWLPDLRAWMKADHLRALADGTQIVASVSSATRGPGDYVLKWDGRDAQGHPLPNGDYALLIEAAREHGTHQVTRHSFSLPSATGRVELPSNPELSAISVEFHRPRGI